MVHPVYPSCLPSPLHPVRNVHSLAHKSLPDVLQTFQKEVSNGNLVTWCVVPRCEAGYTSMDVSYHVVKHAIPE